MKDEILEFVKKYESYNQDDIIAKHLEYGTIDAIKVDGDIKGVVRYNISESGKLADILELYVDSKLGFRIIKDFIRNGLNNYPSLELIRFFRDKKYPGRKPKIVKIRELIKEN